MPEFGFPCPQCNEQLQCDATHIGSRINCPACLQSIIVPPAPANVPAIRIKRATLKRVGLISIAALLVIALAIIAFQFFGGSRSVTFRAYVDGADVVKLSGERLWIEHLLWQQPVRNSVNGTTWNPTWNETHSPSFPNWSDNESRPYTLKRRFSPHNPDNIKLVKIAGRGPIVIIEKPSPDNHQTLAIRLDDGPMSGADWYEFKVSW
jgi:hypothetical protein